VEERPLTEYEGRTVGSRHLRLGVGAVRKLGKEEEVKSALFARPGGEEG